MQMPFISLKEILEKDVAHGGAQVVEFGKPGSGKTGLLLGLAHRLIDHEICIWRGLKTGQAFRFAGNLKIFAYQCDPKFYDGRGKLMKVKVNHISNFDALLRDAELGKLNVLYMPFDTQSVSERSYWIAFADFLIKRIPFRYPSGYVSLFIDEFEDVVPFQEIGTAKEVKDFVNRMKEFRKVLVSLYCATQQYFDLDYRAIGKFQYRIYLHGSKIRRQERFYQETIDSLPIGAGILTGGFFAKFVFGNYPTRKIVVVR